jgi:hypothetical protein
VRLDWVGGISGDRKGQAQMEALAGVQVRPKLTVSHIDGGGIAGLGEGGGADGLTTPGKQAKVLLGDPDPRTLAVLSPKWSSLYSGSWFILPIDCDVENGHTGRSWVSC